MKAWLPAEDIILLFFLQESEFDWQSKICSVKIKIKNLHLSYMKRSNCSELWFRESISAEMTQQWCKTQEPAKRGQSWGCKHPRSVHHPQVVFSETMGRLKNISSSFRQQNTVLSMSRQALIFCRGTGVYTDLCTFHFPLYTTAQSSHFEQLKVW